MDASIATLRPNMVLMSWSVMALGAAGQVKPASAATTGEVAGKELGRVCRPAWARGGGATHHAPR